MITATVVTVSIIALFTDLKYRIIPNKLTYPVILFALIYHSAISGFQGFTFSLSGLALGTAFLIIPALSGGMGGGDLKFVMMIGALTGPYFVTDFFVFTCISGGVIALLMLIKQKLLWKTLKDIAMFSWYILITGGKVRLQITSSKLTMPYAVCFAMGMVAALTTGGYL